MSITNYGNPGERILGDVTDIDGHSAGGLDTGEMRRKYNFAEQFTELSIDQTPFFRIVSKIGKKPTDDPQFKFTEKRQSWMKRYGYCMGVGGAAAITNGATAALAADGADLHLFMATDYLSQGNMQNVIGQSANAIGGAGTRPEFYLPGQVVKVNVAATAGGAMNDYRLYQVTAVEAGYVANELDASVAQYGYRNLTDWADLDGEDVTKWHEVTRLTVINVKTTSSLFLTSFTSGPLFDFDSAVTAEADGVAGKSISGTIEPRRSYVVGTSYKEGSTLMEKNWGDQPYTTGFGYTQIFRNEFGMSNTARATALKYEKNEWARLWRDKLIEHKWEIEQTALFGSQGTADVSGDTHYYTQGAVDYVLQNGNLFNLDIATKVQDDFLEDLSQLVDPRYNNSKSMMFFCDTATYNWLHKLGGFFNNNLEMSTNHTASFAVSGKKTSFGVSFTTISTVYGDINVARNIHLDGSGVKIIGVNMNYVKWRPLLGNGVNRDTSIYVGVQTLENTGTDKRVDMILTEGGFEFSMPECHALWK